MYSLLCVLSVDEKLVRVDYNSLSDQMRMEMLIEGFDEKSKGKHQDKEGMYLDVCKWVCVKCDADERVVQCDMKFFISGSVELCYIPPRVKNVCIWHTTLTGSIDFAQVPQHMENFNFYGNQLSGCVDFTQIPQSMRYLHLKSNQVSGSADLTHLPEGLLKLSLDLNQFSGSVDLTQIPKRMSELSLS